MNKGNTFKHSFAATCNDSLSLKAHDVNVCLGPTPVLVNKTIDHLKQLENARLSRLAEDHPDIFLPVDLDVTLEDILEQEEHDLATDNFNYDSTVSDDDNDLEQDEVIHVSYKRRKDRSYRAKNLFTNSDDAIHYLEC